MSSKTANKQIDSAKSIFRRSGGILKTGEALDQGIHRRTLYAMREAGIIERMERGLYRERKKPNPRKLIQFAKTCRVEKVMRPYLEALL